MNNNIMDLFNHDEVKDVKFDVENSKRIYERIRKTQNAVGGRPIIKAKVVPGGVNAFEISGGTKKMLLQSFSGVIIAHHKSNALFPISDAQGDEAENNAPVCSSTDGETGLNVETGELINCETCPHNAYGTAKKGKGKACKNMHRLFIMTENNPIPIVMSLPPTSLDLWRNYALIDVSVAGFELSDLVTEFSLTDTKNDDGKPYSIVNFKIAGKVDNAVKTFCENMGSEIEESPRIAIEGDDYNREKPVLDQTEDAAEAVVEESADDVCVDVDEPQEVDFDTV